MRAIPVGTAAVLEVQVTADMTVDFAELGRVHPVYATYTMAKHFEEAGRKVLLPHLEDGEEGLGSSVSVEHLAPSWVGDRLRIEARCVEVRGNRLTCEVTATDDDGREVGRGTTGQVVLPRDVLDGLLDSANRR
ncbi:thioesterase family protein [Blastococcus jejuensis]|uniref:Thioesterase family protein n=1 Tax=Blastococcus jejuensis TaxID=351224 RepID=A0ABP6P5U9_9ACTN